MGVRNHAREKAFSADVLVVVSFKYLTRRLLRILRSSSDFRRLMSNVQARRIMISRVRPLLINALVALQPFLHVTSHASTARICAKGRMDLVIFLCRVEGERIQHVTVVIVTPRCRERDPSAHEPRSVKIANHLKASLRGALISKTRLVRVIALIQTTSNVRGQVRTNGRRTTLVRQRDGESYGSDADLSILGDTITRRG